MAELGPHQEELRAVTCDDCPLRMLGEEAVQAFFAPDGEEPFYVGDALKHGIAVARGGRRTPLDSDTEPRALVALEEVHGILGFDWTTKESQRLHAFRAPPIMARIVGDNLELQETNWCYPEQEAPYYPVEDAIEQMRTLAQCFMRAKQACKAPK